MTRLSSRTIADYTWTWATYVEARTSSLRGHTLDQANDPQRPRVFLQRVAEAHGSVSAKKAKSVLHGVLAYAVDCGVLASNVMRQVRTVASAASRTAQRDHPRAMTRGERDRSHPGSAQPPAHPARPNGPSLVIASGDNFQSPLPLGLIAVSRRGRPLVTSCQSSLHT
jgi:hypothetical protein